MGAKVEGLDATLANVDEVPIQLRRHLAEVLNEQAFEAAREAKRTMTVNQSVSTGLARTTVDVAKRAHPLDLTAIVSAGGEKTAREDFDYVLAIEFGTHPHFPPVEAVTGQVEALDRWVEREGLASGEDRKETALQVARKINQVGTRAAPFMRPTVKVMRPKVRSALSNVAKDMDITI